MGKTSGVVLPRAVRWSLWLVAGTVFGLLLGFTVGLTKPRLPGPEARLRHPGTTSEQDHLAEANQADIEGTA